jgi:penicillin-binding protein 1C
MRISLALRYLAIVTAFVTLGGVAWLYWPVDVPDFSAVRSRYTPSEAYLLDRNGKLIGSERVDFGVRRFEWVPLDDISPALLDEIVGGEDRRFWQHNGVDWRGVAGAARDRLDRRQRGASTITMQVASMIEHLARPRGSLAAWVRKLREVRVAYALERNWSKRQILEAYLNLLEFRGELQGIGAAATVLAHKAPSGLAAAESAVLAALLPAPNQLQNELVARACARERQRPMPVPCDAIASAAVQLLTPQFTAADPNQLAPQLAQALLRNPGERVTTTLDLATQKLAHEVLTQQLGELAGRNVRDGAVLVVDNASGDVLAYVASAGTETRAAQVDGVRAHRQAGSTLKPFLYGMALERRYLTAASLLDDSSINLDTASGAYVPQDYDHDFKGLVSVRTALASSLNVPAVRTLVLIGVEPFRDRLQTLGYAGLVEQGDFYGYSLALGSAEVSLWEQAQAYRALARGGLWSALRVRKEDAASQVGAKRTLPSDTSFVIADILSDRAARALTFGLDNRLNTPFWSAVKTGTSKDMRDNWCIGFSQRYTVAVWVGNFEGDAMRGVSGVTGAAPIWHDVMTGLHRDITSLPPTPPDGVVARTTQFSPAVEPPRREWFVADAQATNIVAVSPAQRIPHITSPANGEVLALDPDIPAGQQRVPIVTDGENPGDILTLDGRELARANVPLLWSPQSGLHELSLTNKSGTMLDSVRFTVR